MTHSDPVKTYWNKLEEHKFDHPDFSKLFFEDILELAVLKESISENTNEYLCDDHQLITNFIGVTNSSNQNEIERVEDFLKVTQKLLVKFYKDEIEEDFDSAWAPDHVPDEYDAFMDPLREARAHAN